MLRPGIHQLRALGARVTVVQGNGEALLVDVGARGSWPLVAAGLGRLGLTPANVWLIALTHYHPDHIGALDRAVGATGAAVAAHRAEAPFINGEEPPPNPFRNAALAALARPVLPLIQGPVVPVHHPLDDGQLLPFSEEVRVVHSPGHTPGNVCLYLPRRRALIAGDTLQYQFRYLRAPAPFGCWDPVQARRSLAKLRELDFDTIYFSHAPPLRSRARAAVAQLVSRQARV